MRLTIIAAMLAATATTATAQDQCAPRDSVVKALESGYGETPHALAIDASGALIETFASQQSGSWTVTRTVPGRDTCLVASGYNYQRLQVEAPKPGDDT